jgi:hypothetical protein
LHCGLVDCVEVDAVSMGQSRRFRVVVEGEHPRRHHPGHKRLSEQVRALEKGEAGIAPFAGAVETGCLHHELVAMA